MRKLLLFLLLTVTAISAGAQSLDECRRLAQEHYPEIQQYDLLTLTEQYDLSNIARGWLPRIALSAQTTWQTDVARYPDALSAMLAQQGVEIPGMRKDQYKIAIDVSQTIWDGGQSQADRAIARAQTDEQRGRVDVTLYELQSRVDDLYFGILLLEQNQAQTEALITLLERTHARLNAYLNNGVATQADADAVEAELLTARQTLTQVISSRNCYRGMLELFIGRTLDSERLERPAASGLQSHSPARPELSLFDAQSRLIDARRRGVVSSLKPRFSAFAQGYYGYPGMDMFRSMMSSEWTLNAMVGVRMSWNIGSFYTAKNHLGKLAAAGRQIEVQRDVFLFNTQLQTTREENEIGRLRQIITDDRRIVELRRSIRQAAQSRLDNGVIDATDLLRKITDETTASLNLNTHEIELLQAVYRLKYTLNQ